MSKLVAKTVKKSPLVIAIMAILFAAAVVITAIFGVNYAATANDAETVTVTMNSFIYKTDVEDVESICEAEFEKQGLKFKYEQHGATNGDDCEIVYVFKAGTDATKAVQNLNAAFEKKTGSNTDAWYGFEISVNSASETLPVKVAASNYIRAAIAVTFFAVLAFLYVALRYRLHMGIFAALCVLVGSVLTASVVLLTRIPFTTVTLAAIALSALITAIFTMLTLNKLRTNTKSGAYADNEALTVESVPVCEILLYTAALGVALILVGAIATASTRWFALAALVALVVSAAVSIFFAPALYLPLKARADVRAENSAKGYKGAKSTKAPKAKKAAAAQESVEIASEKLAEQEPVAEETAEEVVEETVEEVAEETAEETVEEVAEETTEETVEEEKEEADAE